MHFQRQALDSSLCLVLCMLWHDKPTLPSLLVGAIPASSALQPPVAYLRMLGSVQSMCLTHSYELPSCRTHTCCSQVPRSVTISEVH
jgi:hypothetical protein